MVQIPQKRSDQTRVSLGSSGSPIVASTFYASNEIDVRGWTWVDFLVEIDNNTGGGPDVAALDAIIEFAHTDSPVTWQRVKVEDIDRPGGAGNLNDLVLTDPQAGSRDQAVFTVPVFGMFMRIRVAPDAAAVPGGTTNLDFFAFRRN